LHTLDYEVDKWANGVVTIMLSATPAICYLLQSDDSQILFGCLG